MGRRKQPEIRERLLRACADHALDHGLPDRLGPFAQATGVSPRMLLYHFETRDALRREVLREARSRQRRFYGDLLRPRAGEPYLDTLAGAWTAMTSAEGRRFLQLFGRLREDADERLWPGFRLEATTDWLGPFAEGMGSLGRPELATLVLALIRGLIMDLEATEDAPRVDGAFADFVAALRATVGPVDDPSA